MSARRTGRMPVIITLLAIISLLLAACGDPGSSSGPGASPGSTPGDAAGVRDENDPPNEDAYVPVAPPANPDEGLTIPEFEVTDVLTGSLSLGAAGAPTSTTLGAAGGTVNVDGLGLAVAAETLAADTRFSVTVTPVSGVEGAGYGGAVAPLTPLYTIEAGETDLANPVTVALDVAPAPAGTTPMAFYYDRETGVLSPLSPLNFADGQLTALATHFSDVLAMAVDWSKIPAVADSGFRPGVDDWQFNNYGSYVAPGGQCEGQTLSEIWYYNQRRAGSGGSALHGLYDNNGAEVKTPTLWEDDSQGYRLVGSIHDDPTVNVPLYLARRNSQWAAADNRLTYDAFRAAIALSGEPQMIRISTDGVDGGHTMVVYRVGKGRLWIADPNYHAAPRQILFDAKTGTMGPYRSGASATSIAADGGTSYTHFAYVPVTAARTEAAIAARWAEFEANAAGDATFPSYSLLALTDRVDAAGKKKWEPLTDGYTTDQATLTIQVTRLGNGRPSSMGVYPANNSQWLGNFGWRQVLNLAEGPNPFGFEIRGKPADTWQYVDFVRRTIVRAPAEATTPPAVTGGHWTLASSAAENGPWSESFTKADETLKFSITDGGATVAYNYDGPPHRNESGSVSWGSPPASAGPDDAWATTLTAAGTCKADIDESWAMGVGVGIVWPTAGEMGATNVAASATCQKGSESVPLSWTFPDAPAVAGSQVKITVSAGDPHGSDTWNYVYDWQP